MIYLLNDRLIHIQWSIFKGTSQVREDFSRALVKVFLIGPDEKYLLDATAQNGTLAMDVPQGLPEGAYSIECIYVKNYENLLPVRGTLTPSGEPVCHRFPWSHPHNPHFIHPHDHRSNDRCLMRSRMDYVFALTSVPSEADGVSSDGEATLRFKSSVASYGYDGLSAYEIAVMRGDFNGSEGEWLEYIYGEKKWEERFIFYLKKHIDNNTIYWDEKNRVIKAKGGIPEPEIYILYGNILDEITAFSQITLDMIVSSTNHIIKIKPQTLPKTSLGTLQAGSKVVVLIPNGHEYVATKDNGIGGKVPFDESIMGANGQSISLGDNLYKIYGEFMTVSGEIFIYIDKH